MQMLNTNAKEADFKTRETSCVCLYYSIPCYHDVRKASEVKSENKSVVFIEDRALLASCKWL